MMESNEGEVKTSQTDSFLMCRITNVLYIQIHLHKDGIHYNMNNWDTVNADLAVKHAFTF